MQTGWARSAGRAGKQDEVLHTRHSFQMTMRADNHVQPDLACEIFVLEPESGPSAVS